MSLEDIRSECSDTAGLLQPYVDGELSHGEQERVAGHLEGCRPCRTAVAEQAWVRAALQSTERDVAPQALRAKILLELDTVDAERATAERAEAAAQPGAGFGARLWGRVRDVMRGGLIMVPAGAVAVGLFFMARSGLLEEPIAVEGHSIGGAMIGANVTPHDKDVVEALGELEPQVSFPIQVPDRASGAPGGVQLVTAQLDANPAAEDRALQLRYRIGKGMQLVDHQRPARLYRPRGAQANLPSGVYFLDRSPDGQPVIYFEVDGVGHKVILEGGTPMDAESGPPDVSVPGPDFTLLFRFAEAVRRTNHGTPAGARPGRPSAAGH